MELDIHMSNNDMNISICWQPYTKYTLESSQNPSLLQNGKVSIKENHPWDSFMFNLNGLMLIISVFKFTPFRLSLTSCLNWTLKKPSMRNSLYNSFMHNLFVTMSSVHSNNKAKWNIVLQNTSLKQSKEFLVYFSSLHQGHWGMEGAPLLPTSALNKWLHVISITPLISFKESHTMKSIW